MRTKDNLFAIEDAALLMQYLYMSDEHKIKITNSIGVPLVITMRDDFTVMCQNANFPHLPPMNFDSSLTLGETIGLVKQLKSLPATEFPDHFASRWEEIAETTRANLALNEK